MKQSICSFLKRGKSNTQDLHNFFSKNTTIKILSPFNEDITNNMQQELNLKTICFSLLVFLLAQDAASPPADLPKDGPLEIDRIGNLNVLVFVWNRSKLEQQILSILITIPLVLLWHNALLRGKNQGGNVERLSVSSWNITVIVTTIIGLCGYALRRWSQITLAEFFTYQISTPAHIIISGPYQFLVHPGYSGAFIHMSAFIMLLTTPLNQRGKLTYLKVPITILLIAALSKIFLQRIEDEEILLSEHFGEQWTAHLNDKWRLFPYIY